MTTTPLPWEVGDGDVDLLADAQSTPFDLEAWESRGRELATRETDVKWELGDWLVDGDDKVPAFPIISKKDVRITDIESARQADVYDYAVRITGLARGTLKDLASTARRFPSSVRTDALSWSHHRVLINARPNANETELKKWLARAVDENLAVAAFKKAAQLSRESVKTKSFLVTVSLDVWETLKDFADDERSSVQEVAAEFLSGIVLEEETQQRRELAKKEVKERRREKRRTVGERVARDYDPLGLRR